jgi:hypothetical protein
LPAAAQATEPAAPSPEGKERAARPSALPGVDRGSREGGLAAYPGDPAEVLGVAIDTLRDDEILAALSTITDLDAEELRDVRDPRALARRMSEIALEDLIHAPRDRPADLARVYFSEDVLTDDPAHDGAGTSRVFNGKDPILASFPNEEYAGDRVFLKWSRLDDPGIVLFRPYTVTRGARYSEIWLEPDEGLAPGRYRVAFYSADEAMHPVASGNYSVVASNDD